MKRPPLVLDLYCGLGGWASGFASEGWSVIGVDNVDFSSEYPGCFILADLLAWRGFQSLNGLVNLVVASPPCQQFSRWSMPWTRAKNPPKPDLTLWQRSRDIACKLRVPLVVENVRGAQLFMGRSQFNCGPFHFWGDVPPLMPPFTGKSKESFSSAQAQKRAVLPATLSQHFARCFLRTLEI